MSDVVKPALDIISSNLSGNRLGRALVLADCLRGEYQVRILGMLKHKARIWQTAGERKEIELVPIRYYSFPFYFISLFSLLLKVRSRAVIAVKPLCSSYGAALLLKLFRRRKVILDIDDDETALLSEGKSFSDKYLNFNPDRYVMTRILRGFIKFADEITVCNEYLREKYGGTVIVHAREAWKYSLNESKAELKRRLGVREDKFVICHIGTYRLHKGLERVVEALDILGDGGIVFLYTANKDYLPKRDYVLRQEEFAWDKLGEVLGGCDLGVFFLQAGRVSASQFPAKIADAMMAGMPFIASDTPGIRSLIGESIFLIDSRASAGDLAARIKWMKDNYSEALKEAVRLRELAKADFSIEAVSVKLREVLAR